MKRAIPILAILLVVLVAGCTGFDIPGISPGIFGDEPIKTELPADVITVQNLNVIPSPPILADSDDSDDFSVSFQVVNQDEINEVENVVVKLTDSGLCTLRIPDGIYTVDIDDMAPQETEFIEWRFDAPSNDQIGNLKSNCPIRYKISYDIMAKTQVSSLVMSETKINQLQRTGETPTFTPDQIISRGPIKTSFSFGTSQPIKTGITVPIFIKIEDKGTGLLNFPTSGVDIHPYRLILGMPNAFTKSSCDKFDDTVPNDAFAVFSIKEEGRQPEYHFVEDPLMDEDDNDYIEIYSDVLDMMIRVVSFNLVEGRLDLRVDYGGLADSTVVLENTEDGREMSRTFTRKYIFTLDYLKDFNEQPGYTYYWNIDDIPFVRKSSVQLRCSMKAPGEDVVEEEKTYFFTSYLEYPYKIDSKVDVSIEPSLEQ